MASIMLTDTQAYTFGFRGLRVLRVLTGGPRRLFCVRGRLLIEVAPLVELACFKLHRLGLEQFLNSADPLVDLLIDTGKRVC